MVGPALPPPLVSRPEKVGQRASTWAPRAEFGGVKLATAVVIGDDLPKASWEPCSAGREGCRRLPFELAKEANLRFFGGNTAEGAKIAMAWQQGERLLVALRGLDGPPFVVFDIVGVKDTYGVRAEFASETAGLAIDASAEYGTALFLGPLRDDPAWYAPFAHTDFRGERRGVQLQGRSFTLRERGGLRRSDDGGVFAPMLAGGDIDWAVGVGDAVIYGADRHGADVQLLRPGSKPQPLIKVGPRQQVGGLAADGDRLYWLLAEVDEDEAGYRRPEDPDWQFGEAHVWTATLPASGARIVPRRLTGKIYMPPHWLPQLHAYGGKLAFTEPGMKDRMLSSDLEVYDAVTGEQEFHGLPDSVHVNDIVVLTRGEVVVTQQSWQGHHDVGLVRLALDR